MSIEDIANNNEQENIERIYDMLEAVENARKIFMSEKTSNPNYYGLALSDFHIGYLYN